MLYAKTRIIILLAFSITLSGCYQMRSFHPEPFDEIFSTHRIYGSQFDEVYRTTRIESLLKRLGDRNVFVRRHAALALGGVRSANSDVVPALIDALNDKDELVRQNAVITLKRIATPQAKEAVAEYEKNNC